MTGFLTGRTIYVWIYDKAGKAVTTNCTLGSVPAGGTYVQEIKPNTDACRANPSDLLILEPPEPLGPLPRRPAAGWSGIS